MRLTDRRCALAFVLGIALVAAAAFVANSNGHDRQVELEPIATIDLDRLIDTAVAELTASPQPAATIPPDLKPCGTLTPASGGTIGAMVDAALATVRASNC